MSAMHNMLIREGARSENLGGQVVMRCAADAAALSILPKNFGGRCVPPAPSLPSSLQSFAGMAQGLKIWVGK